MTSGKFQHIPVSEITIVREQRQRKSLDGIEELADSIRRAGLINPPVVTREHVLVTGERRLTAIKFLGWTHVPVQYVDEMDPIELHLIELEENLRRQDLTWQEECKAVYDYHNMRIQLDPSWDQPHTAEALGIKQNSVSERIAVAEEMQTDERIATADKYSVARTLTTKKRERKADLTLESLVGPAPKEDEEENDVPTVAAPILEKDFVEWAKSYDGPKYNFIHCDFPYGVNADKMQQGSSVARHGGYTDSPETFWRLVDCFHENLDRFMARKGHIMFWFSMDYYHELLEYFNDADKGLVCNPLPLIWHKTDNAGIIRDYRRGPRHIYETAFLISRGDRKINEVVADCIGCATTKDIHMSEKPRPVLRHFFRMFVDESSHVLDPTCGGGNALIVAEQAGAKTVLGIEMEPEFAQLARENYARNREDPLAGAVTTTTG